MRVPPLGAEPERPGENADGRGPEHRRRRPSPQASLNQREGHAGERGDREPLRPEVRVTKRAWDRRHVPRRQPEAADADREIDEKDAAPAEEMCQHASHDRSGGHRESRRRRPDANRVSPFCGVVVVVPQQRERRGDLDRGADPLKSAKRDERAEARRDPAKH